MRTGTRHQSGAWKGTSMLRESYIRDYGEKAGPIILSYRGKIARLTQLVIHWRAEALRWKERACMAEAALWVLKEGGQP